MHMCTDHFQENYVYYLAFRFLDFTGSQSSITFAGVCWLLNTLPWVCHLALAGIEPWLIFSWGRVWIEIKNPNCQQEARLSPPSDFHTRFYFTLLGLWFLPTLMFSLILTRSGLLFKMSRLWAFLTNWAASSQPLSRPCGGDAPASGKCQQINKPLVLEEMGLLDARRAQSRFSVCNHLKMLFPPRF